MKHLTDHAKTILRAIADGKRIEHYYDNEWWSASPSTVFKHLESCNTDKLRIKPETRSINGVEFFAATGGNFDLRIIPGGQYLQNREFCFAAMKDRDTAYQAIVDALEGKSK